MNQVQRLFRVHQKSKRRAIGLMSGMSMDGVDLACADLEGEFPDLKVSLVATSYRAFSPELRARLRRAIEGNPAEISELNVLIGEEFARTVMNFLDAQAIPKASIDFIGSHGQTLFHNGTSSVTSVASTLQIGSPSVIAQMTGLITVGNFRSRDLAGGGHGAPLVGLADYLLYRNGDELVALNNLGSISNVSVVTPHIEDMLVFDTGPANVGIDHVARMIPGNASGFDIDGRYSAQGRILPEILSGWMANDFYRKPPPKTAGFNEFLFDELSAQALQEKPADLLRTALEVSALSLRDAYRNFVIPRFPTLRKIIFSGGGVHNQTLIARIKSHLPEFEIVVMDPAISDAKEALAFAILANETLSGRPGSYPSMTGIAKPSILGEICL